MKIISLLSFAFLANAADTTNEQPKRFLPVKVALPKYDDVFCKDIACPQIQCEQPYTPPGQCCPICLEKFPGDVQPVVDSLNNATQTVKTTVAKFATIQQCSTITCETPACDKPLNIPGMCCPTCPTTILKDATRQLPDFFAKCDQKEDPQCLKVFNELLQPGALLEDIKYLLQNCTDKVCPTLQCEKSFTPLGACCPICLPDIPVPTPLPSKCATVVCPLTGCINSVIPEGECCPVCVTEEEEPQARLRRMKAV